MQGKTNVFPVFVRILEVKKGTSHAEIWSLWWGIAGVRMTLKVRFNRYIQAESWLVVLVSTL